MGQDSRGSYGAAGASTKVPVISHIQLPANTIRRYLLKELVTEFRWAINSLSRRRIRLPAELPATRRAAAVRIISPR